MSRIKDLRGRRFDRLTVLECIGTDKWSSAIWSCRCDCGNIVNVKASNLGRKVHSCGCLNKEMARMKYRKPFGIAAKNGTLAGYKNSARKRNLVFELSWDEFIHMTSQNCFYCGSKPKQVYSSSNNTGDYIHNGIDRIDNSKGYTLENCVSCCKICNYAKQRMHQKNFYSWIINVYNHLELESYK